MMMGKQSAEYIKSEASTPHQMYDGLGRSPCTSIRCWALRQARKSRRWRKRKHSFGRIGGGRTRIPAPMDEAVMQTRLMEPTLTSVPIPKFAHPRGPLRCELRNQGDTSNFDDSSAAFGFEVAKRARGHNDRNFKSAALDDVIILAPHGAKERAAKCRLRTLHSSTEATRSGHRTRSANVIYLTPG